VYKKFGWRPSINRAKIARDPSKSLDVLATYIAVENQQAIIKKATFCQKTGSRRALVKFTRCPGENSRSLVILKADKGLGPSLAVKDQQAPIKDSIVVLQHSCWCPEQSGRVAHVSTIPWRSKVGRAVFVPTRGHVGTGKHSDEASTDVRVVVGKQRHELH
jgi:hypothetical protein